MSPADRQSRLVQELLRFEDAHERLAYVQDRAKRQPNFPPENRTEERRIQGCATKLWLTSTCSEGRFLYLVDSESALVRGLACLYAETYSGATSAEILAFQCSVLSGAKLSSRITPTRLHGLLQLEGAIHAFAAQTPLAPPACT